jgi:hypothetical protein
MSPMGRDVAEVTRTTFLSERQQHTGQKHWEIALKRRRANETPENQIRPIKASRGKIFLTRFFVLVKLPHRQIGCI